MATIPDSAAAVINNVVGSPNLITNEVEYSAYGYNIRLGVAAWFTAAFALTFIAHVIQAGLSRRWFLFWTLCLGAGGEMAGWIGRLASATSTVWEPTYGGVWQSSDNAFMAQICCLIIAPAFEMAANYILLGVLISNLGLQYSRLEPRTYVWLFCTGDIISLIVQAAGGGIAASADTLSGANVGGYIMAGGVIFQMVIMICFTYLFIEFTVRYRTDRPTTQLKLSCFGRRRKTGASDGASQRTAVEIGNDAPFDRRKANLMLLGLALSTAFVFIRSVYRCPELLAGWNGPIIENQPLFDGLDGGMILISLVALNILHPHWLIPRTPRSVTTAGDEAGAMKEAHRASF